MRKNLGMLEGLSTFLSPDPLPVCLQKCVEWVENGGEIGNELAIIVQQSQEYEQSSCTVRGVGALTIAVTS